MPTVSIADRLFLTADSAETPQHVACLATFFIPDGAADDWVGKLAEKLRSQDTVTPPFNYKLRSLALKNVAPIWDIVPDDEVDFDFHFRHSALPKPGGERELGVLVSRLHSTPLDPTRPLWEFHLIEGLDRGRFAIYFKTHHALMDGVGGVKRISQMISPDPELLDPIALWAAAPTAHKSSNKPKSSVAQLLRSAGFGMYDGARTTAGLGMSAGSMVVEALRKTNPDIAVPFVAPKSVINGRIGRQRRVATQSYEFTRIQRVAKAGDVKINDVFLAICAGGLRRYLDELEKLPAESLIAGAPVNLRAAGDESTSNTFSMIVVKLGTDIADPVERLEAIARSTAVGKERLANLPSRASALYPALFMGPLVVENLIGVGGQTAPPYNVSISNVPGPLEQQYLAGAPLEATYPLGLLYHGVGLMIALFTSSGRLGFGFTGDRDSLPHLQRLALYTGEALEELETALGLEPGKAR